MCPEFGGGCREGCESWESHEARWWLRDSMGHKNKRESWNFACNFHGLECETGKQRVEDDVGWLSLQRWNCHRNHRAMRGADGATVGTIAMAHVGMAGTAGGPLLAVEARALFVALAMDSIVERLLGNQPITEHIERVCPIVDVVDGLSEADSPGVFHHVEERDL